MISKSVVGKLWLTIVTMIIILLILLGFLLSQIMENFYFELKTEEMIRQGTQIAELIGSENQTKSGDLTQNLKMLSEFTDANIMIVDRRGLVQACRGVPGVRPGHHLNIPDLDRVMRGEILARKGLHPVYNVQMLSIAIPVYQNRLIVGSVLMDAPVEDITETVENIRELILYAAMAIIVIATIVTYFLAKSISRPLIQMNSAALAMARGNYGQKVDVNSSDEVGTLSRTLNFLSEELEQNISELSREKRKLANVLSSMTEGVISFDQQGRIITLNPPVKGILELDENITPGQFMPISIKAVKEIEKLARQVFSSSEPLVEEATINNKFVKLRLAPIMSTGSVTGVVVVVSDVTKEKKLDKMRREFVANVSHELRTPLSFLQGYTEAILDGLAETEEEKEKYLQIILEETLRLRRLVNELLDLTQIEAGQLNLNLQRVSLNELLKKVIVKIEPVLKDKGIKMNLHIGAGIDYAVIDSDRIEQAIINLLDNAIKYTQEGGKIDLMAIQKDDKYVTVIVEDTGVGIPKDELPFIFERFYKTDKARTRSQDLGGTGLGLSIVKNIINAHGGEIYADSSWGQGTKFTFNIPKLSE
ncbi:two-component system sensor histidine kinase ResE [Desulfitispora alkaliphila]|uniref:ATP-binding protein n=1 Tax=Desulfitispora alkaliphila TaxID=622674 RepID=UPI003D195213